MPVTIEQARSAKESAKSVLAALPGVVGVGITKLADDHAIKVNLSEPLPLGTFAPTSVGDVTVIVEVVGRITKRR